MKRRKPLVTDRRRFTIDEMMVPDKIPFGSGRPVRDNGIGKDDLINLRIALGLSNSINDFIDKKGMFEKEI